MENLPFESYQVEPCGVRVQHDLEPGVAERDPRRRPFGVLVQFWFQVQGVWAQTWPLWDLVASCLVLATAEPVQLVYGVVHEMGSIHTLYIDIDFVIQSTQENWTLAKEINSKYYKKYKGVLTQW